jgi:hypothetical protein
MIKYQIALRVYKRRAGLPGPRHSSFEYRRVVMQNPYLTLTTHQSAIVSKTLMTDKSLKL